jgi:hypothetical protein
LAKVELKFLLAVHKSFSAILAIYCAVVNNKVKAVPKKRKHLMTRNLSSSLAKISMIKYQALWYSTFIALYIWFLFWVSYDFFVLHTPIIEVNLVNLIGSIVSIAFIWAGTKIWKRNGTEAGKLQQKSMQQYMPQKASANHDILKRNRTETRKLQQKSMQQYMPQKASANHDSTCNHNLGYLYQRQQLMEIPAECVTCKSLIQCLSPKK